MLKKRIIPCLDIVQGITVKGVNFVDLKDAGDPVELGLTYSEHGADELVFLDITATNEKRQTLVELVERIASVINIPFTVGGGIQSIQDVEALLKAGADKVSINSAAVHNPALISEIAKAFGNQCVVVAIDVNRNNKGEWLVHTHGGTRPTAINAVEWAGEVARLGAGEILLTSMTQDGTKSGFSHSITQQVCNAVQIPVIASGGAGSVEHFEQLFKETDASAALAASIFHFGEIPIPELKSALKTANIPIR